MAKMFDKVSQDFLSAIKGVLEAKTVNKHGHDHPGEEDEDIDNDGDSDKSDKYLHNRRKAIGKAMIKKESAEQIDELSRATVGRYSMKAKSIADNEGGKDRTKGRELAGRKKWGGTMSGVKPAKVMATEDAEQIDELSKGALGNYIKQAKKHVRYAGKLYVRARQDDNENEKKYADNLARKRYKGINQAVDKLTKEDVEQIDELSKDTLHNYADKAADARSHRKLSTKKVDNRYKGVATAYKKLLAKEDVEQVDEISKATMGRYINRAKDQIDAASYRQGHRDSRGSGGDTVAKGIERKLSKRHGGIELAVKKLTKEEAALTPEEIEMIEAKMAGVAPGSMDCDKHMCATKVFHKEWAEGTPIKTMHADPDADGLIEWYDVMFDHGIERVMTEDMEILQAESHMHSKKKMKEEVEELDELSRGTLASYAKKAMKDAPEKDRQGKAFSDLAGDDAKRGDREGASHFGKRAAQSYIKAANRRAGTMKAIDKLAKEEVEELDEISSDLATRYLNKAQSSRANDKAHSALPMKKRDNRMAGSNLAREKIRAGQNKDSMARVGTNEEIELDEARGRPKKAAAKDFTVHPITKQKLMHDNPEHMKTIERLQKNKVLEKPKTEASQHIMNQLQKAKTSMRGGETIHFTHGESKHVSGSHASKLISKYQGMKPSEKEDFQKKISHSHEQLMKHV